MTSIDWWNVLQDDARANGPDALELVLKVGEARFNTLLNGRAARAYARFLDGYPPEPSQPVGIFKSYEADMRALLVLRPGRFDFPSERARRASATRSEPS